MFGYSHKVTYTKKFTSGLLDGVEFEEALRFPTLDTAEAFAVKIDGRLITPCVGGSSYFVVNAVVSKLP